MILFFIVTKLLPPRSTRTYTLFPYTSHFRSPDDSWKNVAKKYQSEPRVQWHSIATEHANVARNYGKQLARGKYIRFLDDDDYLLPAATKQLGIAVNTKAEITSGSVDLVTDEIGRAHV